MVLCGSPWSHINIFGPPQSTLVSKKGNTKIEENDQKIKNEKKNIIENVIKTLDFA